MAGKTLADGDVMLFISELFLEQSTLLLMIVDLRLFGGSLILLRFLRHLFLLDRMQRWVLAPPLRDRRTRCGLRRAAPASRRKARCGCGHRRGCCVSRQGSRRLRGSFVHYVIVAALLLLPPGCRCRSNVLSVPERFPAYFILFLRCPT